VSTPIKQEINFALSSSFAFGGNNTSLVFGKI
jgi:3-oxoacyl-(acyl-carrier-protein) synthase